MDRILKLAKYGTVGVAIIALLLAGFIFKVSMETVNNQNALMNNHFTDFTGAIYELTTEIKVLSERLK